MNRHLVLGFIILLTTPDIDLALTEEEKAAALDLAVGATSTTLLLFQRICGQDASRDARLIELKSIKMNLEDSFAETVLNNLSPAEQLQVKAIGNRILATKEEYVKICSSNDDKKERLEKLRRHAERITNEAGNWNKQAVIDGARKPTFDNCKWFGTAPFCRGRCPDGWWLNKMDSFGDGKTCLVGKKTFCCS